MHTIGKMLVLEVNYMRQRPGIFSLLFDFWAITCYAMAIYRIRALSDALILAFITRNKALISFV